MANGQSYVGYLIVLIFCSYVHGTRKTGFYPVGTQNEINVGNTNLRFVSVVFRHGDRTLDNANVTYPNDPYKNRNDYPNNNGLLTNAGKERAYQLGQILKTTYGHFLGDIYYPPNVYARSSVVPRTKMTLQLVLAALYPPVSDQRWNITLNWQPVDMIYTSASQDDLLFPYQCKEYKQAYTNVLKSQAVITEVNTFNNLMQNLSQTTGQNITNIFELFLLYHILLTQSSMSLILPTWTHDIFPRGKLYDAALLQYKLYNYNNKLIRFNGGALLYKILEDMTGVINGTLPDRKISLFSAHDVNVIAMLYALGIHDDSIPEYTSSVIMELREKDGKYFVRVLRYLGIPSSLIEVNIPDCSLLCPLEKFILLKTSTTAKRENPNCPMTSSLI